MNWSRHPEGSVKARCVAFLREFGPQTVIDLARLTALNIDVVRTALAQMKNANIINIAGYRYRTDDGASRVRLLQVYGVAGAHQPADPAVRAAMLAENLRLRGSTFSRTKKTPRTRAASIGRIAGPCISRSYKWPSGRPW
jgi:hypothetical protein